MIDKLVDILLKEYEECRYLEDIYPERVRLREKSEKAIQEYRENKTEENEKKIIDVFLETFWDWTGFDTITEYKEDENCYVSPALLNRMKERTKGIFYLLHKDVKQGIDKNKLGEKYECLSEVFWIDLEFLLWGVRQKEEDGRIMGVTVPVWLKTSLNKEEYKELERCSLNMLSWGEPRGQMYSYIYQLLDIKYKD